MRRIPMTNNTAIVRHKRSVGVVVYSVIVGNRLEFTHSREKAKKLLEKSIERFSIDTHVHSINLSNGKINENVKLA